MMKEVKCETFHWGPLLCRFKVPHDSINILLKDGSKKETYTPTLAGIIEKEFTYPSTIFLDQLSSYFRAYSNMVRTYYNMKVNKEFELTATPWINYMVAGEFNPPHIHPMNHFSCVVFLQIPDDLKEENQKYKGTSIGPGGLVFRYGENGLINLITHEFFPEVGDFYIFPADLAHWVFPFKSKGERISISANFKFKTNENKEV